MSSAKIPLVGILFHAVSPIEIASFVKRLRPDIRFDVIVRGHPSISSEELQSLKSCEILLVDPNIVVDKELTYTLTNLKWMHSLWAGIDRLSRSVSQSKLIPSFVLTRNGGYYCQQMAEYVIGYVIDRERHISEMRTLQQQKLWKRLPYKTLAELTLGIVGFGDIGKEVARIAKAFGMRICALVRSMPSESEKCSDVDEYRLSAELPHLLSSSDYVVSILPSVPSTDGFFDGDVLSHCKTKKTVFINIGRGNVVKEETIITALDNDWIGAAVLDVFNVEPLPESHPLWKHPKVTITPHVAGLYLNLKKIVEDFIQSYDLFMRREPLPYTVDWGKGY